MPLVQCRCPQYSSIAPVRTDDLQPDRKPGLRKPARYRDRGHVDEGERERQQQPLDVVRVLLAADLLQPPVKYIRVSPACFWKRLGDQGPI